MSDRGDILAVVEALRTRLTGAGFTVFLGQEIDPQHDELPCISLHMGAEGDRTVVSHNIAKRIGEIEIIAEYWARATSDQLVAGLTAVRDIRRALVGTGVDSPDSLGGNALSITHIVDKVVTRDRQTITAHCVIRVRY
jgi:hypothetical protein